MKKDGKLFGQKLIIFHEGESTPFMENIDLANYHFENNKTLWGEGVSFLKTCLKFKNV